MIRVVVFDFDGTLVDSNGVKEACLHATVADLAGGAEALAAAVRQGGDRYRVFTEVARQLDGEGDAVRIAAHARDLVAAYSRCCSRAIIAAPERARARDTLAVLRRRGLRVWINSATPERHLPELLHRRGLMRFCHGALGGPRSKADNLRMILARERAHARHVLMVGDGPDDAAGAEEVGAWFVALTAEKRLPHRGRFAMKDLTRLVALIDHVWPRPRRTRMSGWP